MITKRGEVKRELGIILKWSVYCGVFTVVVGLLVIGAGVWAGLCPWPAPRFMMFFLPVAFAAGFLFYFFGLMEYWFYLNPRKPKDVM